ncbi:MAG: effector-associated domain EAD1-containing protein [Chloroflexota bacterium]
MNFSGSQFEELHKALLDAFNRSTLARVVRFRLEERLDSIVPGGSDEDVFYGLIEWAERTGQLPDLISAVHGENPDNPKIRQCYQDLIQLNLTQSSLTDHADIHQIVTELERANTGPIIDRVDCVAMFLNLLNADHPHRFFRLTGQAKMGKSHLLTKIFPKIAEHRGLRSIVIDLRELSAIDILQNACGQIDPTGFSTFDATYREWLAQPNSEPENLSTLLGQRSDEKSRAVIAQFTRSFVSDLKDLVQHPILLVFDQVERGSDDVQSWLCNQLLAQLQSIPQVHAITGGRALPPSSGAYASICCEYTLTQVEEVDAYVQYCRQIEADIQEEFIPQLAKALFYNPGAFAESMTQFTTGGHVYG